MEQMVPTKDRKSVVGTSLLPREINVLEEIAWKEHISNSEVIRRALRDYFVKLGYGEVIENGD